jgi:hypothetical protein
MNTTFNDLKGQLSFLGFENAGAIFTKLNDDMASKSSRSSKHYVSSRIDAGRCLFLLRNIMMRHSIQMKSRAEDRSLMSLPPKV